MADRNSTLRASMASSVLLEAQPKKLENAISESTPSRRKFEQIFSSTPVLTQRSGSIQTPLMDKRNALEGVDDSIQHTAIDRIGTSEEVGNLIAWLLSDEASFVTGATYAVDAGWV